MPMEDYLMFYSDSNFESVSKDIKRCSDSYDDFGNKIFLKKNQTQAKTSVVKTTWDYF